MAEAPLRPAPLPEARGELSSAVLGALASAPGSAVVPAGAAVRRADPYGEDLQLALYLCYELHYQGFAGVSDGWEWDPGLLRLRAALEDAFLGALRDGLGRIGGSADALEALLVEPDGEGGLAHHLEARATTDQFREYAAQRSLYHLKEADPHAWVLPRLRGRAKAGMAAIEFDEFGAGRGERVHARLFADLLEDLGLVPDYGHYVDAATAPMFAVVNLMSLLGLHRALRGALVGHFAAVETTSSPASRRLARGLQRLGAGPRAVHFYTEHVEADAVHEQVVRRDVVAGLLAQEPSLDRDVAFGVEATSFTEQRLADQLLAAWGDGRRGVRIAL